MSGGREVPPDLEPGDPVNPERDAPTNEGLADLYQAVLIDHYKNPRGKGPLAGATHEGYAKNPLCGDEMTLRLRVEGGVVAAAAFEGKGCAISQAAASVMTARLAGMKRGTLGALAAAYRAVLRPPEGAAAGAPSAIDIGDLAAFAGVRPFPMRLRCAELPARGLEAALNEPR